ncbi:hypothetical protein [Cupriavidus sp. UME77]|uniref:hypothetical protein n=1 Tax=Cupriavidus sp. UME77 TaxID=1862321 RepID=UPI0015FFBFBA|nr:hypothetical protein [Cupriavidus sp. UME77]MBB1634952.1 hypothetical protein [Cupriavidus sp. UME77]
MFIPTTHTALNYRGTGEIRGSRLGSSLHLTGDGHWVIARNGEKTVLDEDAFFDLLTQTK